MVRETVRDIRPNSVCAVQMTMYMYVVYQPQLKRTHVRLGGCLSVCLCTSIAQKNNGSIHLKLEHTVIYGNSSDELDINNN